MLVLSGKREKKEGKEEQKGKQKGGEEREGEGGKNRENGKRKGGKEKESWFGSPAGHVDLNEICGILWLGKAAFSSWQNFGMSPAEFLEFH